jgi:hypothetical protein
MVEEVRRDPIFPYSQRCLFIRLPILRRQSSNPFEFMSLIDFFVDLSELISIAYQNNC